MEQARAGLNGLAGDFVQRKRLSLFRQELVSRGRFLWRRPNRLRWEYTAPEPSVITLDGTRVTVTTPGAPPETFDLGRRPGMRVLFDQLLAWLGGGSLRQVTKDFEATLLGPRALRLRPRGALARHVVELEVRFDAAYLLAAVRLREKNGDVTAIEFSALRRNPGTGTRP